MSKTRLELMEQLAEAFGVAYCEPDCSCGQHGMEYTVNTAIQYYDARGQDRDRETANAESLAKTVVERDRTIRSMQAEIDKAYERLRRKEPTAHLEEKLRAVIAEEQKSREYWHKRYVSMCNEWSVLHDGIKELLTKSEA